MKNGFDLFVGIGCMNTFGTVKTADYPSLDEFAENFVRSLLLHGTIVIV